MSDDQRQQIEMIPVNFHGDVLWAQKIEGNVFVAIKPICEALGLTWQGQLERMKRDTVLSEGISETLIPSRGGNQEAVCLPLTLLNGWLFGISEGHIADKALRARVIEYKRECYRVLHDHFYNRAVDRVGGVGNLPATERYREILPPVEDLGRLIATVEECRRLRGPDKAWALWLLLGLPDPQVAEEEDPVTMAENFRSLREVGVATGVIGAGAKRSARSVQHYIALLDRLCPEVLEALREHRISVYYARVLMLAPQDQQPELLTAVEAKKFKTCADLEMTIRLINEDPAEE